jgi:ABC-type bacteriocin/lantibiotic exporter with double-glycine peptidase domain
MQVSTQKGYTDKLKKATEGGNQIATEAIMNMRTVAAFNREDKILEQFEAKMREPNAASKKNAHVKGFLVGLGQLFLYSTYTLSFWYGGKLVHNGEYTFEQVLKVGKFQLEKHRYFVSNFSFKLKFFYESDQSIFRFLVLYF